ncbi:MAG TPA: ATP-binding protein [Rhizomicrobium sp.]|jgi:two-component system osmolarity sensor histidine kinase EnvZ|nr:ATP-binding protein [Rhizomicrobium sp.]
MANALSPGRLAKRMLPRGLFGRTLIIVVAPIVLVLAVVTYVFFERDLDTTTRRLARDVAADVAMLVALEDNSAGQDRPRLRQLAARQLQYRLDFQPGRHLGAAAGPPVSTIDKALDDIIEERIGAGRNFATSRAGDAFQIKVNVHDGVLRILVPRDRATVSQPDMFIAWAMGSALILIGIALVFMRNQVRPIERLARAAESFGKGRAVPDFKPYGATEVRRAAQAFITMRERIERFINQRTEMLAGVSHDIKTPLTRMKLALAMMPPGPDIESLRTDIAEMEDMLDDYLAFARGEGGEDSALTDLADLVRDAASAAAKARQAPDVAVVAPDAFPVSVKRAALRRCLSNLIDNAIKHGRRVVVTLRRDERWVEIVVEDDGPGIPEPRREEAFRPFHRLDEGRNLQSGGSGLGLAIARDIARAHGGDITLNDSALGGLAATIRIPV